VEDSEWRRLLGDAGVGLAGGGGGLARALGFGGGGRGFNAGAGDGDGGFNAAGRGDALSPTVVWWGEGAYQEIGGDDGGVDWSGDVLSLHLGVDGNLRWGGRHRDDLYGGWLVSWSDARVDYEDRGGGGDTVTGEYDLELTSVHPYIGRDVMDGRLAVYLTGGYGLGHLEVTDAAGERRADVTMYMAAVGGDGVLRRGESGGELRLRGEALVARTQVARGPAAAAGGIGIAAADVDTHRIRLSVEGARTLALAAGVSLRPTAALGLRVDGGDGLTGGGVEVGGGARYRDAGRRLVTGAHARGLVSHSADVDDWGISGHFELEGGLDGQGWALALAPQYGNAGDSNASAQQLWQRGMTATATGDGDADNTAPRARLNIRASYGLRAFTNTGLLTPFSALTITTDSRRHQLGLQWTQTDRLQLQLTDERNNGVVLKGEMQF